MRNLLPGDAGWILMRHAEHYVGQDGFDDSFEPLVARVLVDFVATRDPASERAWIAADRAGRRLGSILCTRLDAETAQLRLFFVEPDVRREGLGTTLLARCVAFAGAAGYARMKLWTHAEQRAACALYARAGFVLSGIERRLSFGVLASVQTLTLDLTPCEATRADLLQ